MTIVDISIITGISIVITALGKWLTHPVSQEELNVVENRMDSQISDRVRQLNTSTIEDIVDEKIKALPPSPAQQLQTLQLRMDEMEANWKFHDGTKHEELQRGFHRLEKLVTNLQKKVFGGEENNG